MSGDGFGLPSPVPEMIVHGRTLPEAAAKWKVSAGKLHLADGPFDLLPHFLTSCDPYAGTHAGLSFCFSVLGLALRQQVQDLYHFPRLCPLPVCNHHGWAQSEPPASNESWVPNAGLARPFASAQVSLSGLFGS